MEEEKVLTPELAEENLKANAEAEEESLADSVRIVSPGKLVAKRFFRSRLSVVGLVTLVVLFLFAFVGPLFSPWGEAEADSTAPDEIMPNYKHDVWEQTVDKNLIFEGGVTTGAVKDGVTYDPVEKHGYYVDSTGETVYFKLVEEGISESTEEKREEKRVLIVTNEFYNDIEYYEYSWQQKSFNMYGKIDGNHWLGTDKLGYDVFTRLMYGGRVSLTIGFVVVILETLLGVLFGGLAGYFGRWVDQLIMRIVDIFGCIPQIPLLLILSELLNGAGITGPEKLYITMGFLTLLGWAGIARVVRGQILFLREQEYMVAAEALGLSTSRKIIKHLVPNVMPQLIVQMTLGLGGIILTESTLSYLGLGLDISNATWGTMISVAQENEIMRNYPNIWMPAGVLIVLAVLAFNFIGDGLRDAFDPKASK